MPSFFLAMIIILFEYFSKTIILGAPISPCPKIFQYRFDGSDWYGMLAVRNSDLSEALHIKLTLSVRGKPLTDDLGEIELLTRGQYGKDIPVLYKVKFPKSHIPPKLLQIASNGRNLCTAPPDHGIFVTEILLEHTREFSFVGKDVVNEPVKPQKQFFNSFEINPTSSPQSNFYSQSLKNDINCGTIDNRIDQPNDHYGEESSITSRSLQIPAGIFNFTEGVYNLNEDYHGHDEDIELPEKVRGAWPWLAAVYVNNSTSLAYQCSGTLISARVVVTSAHCFHYLKTLYNANEVLVFLGRFNLKNWNEEDSMAASVTDIYLHKDFDSHLTSYDADIAVVLLKPTVRFNKFIRPACLWSGPTAREYVEGEHGTVVGWGYAHVHSSNWFSAAKPRALTAFIVSNATCFKTSGELEHLSSNRTFCAGPIGQNNETNRPGPCTGDSGAGLLIYKNKQWILRGIVSGAVPKDGRKCTNRQEYVIYTDVAMFLDWLWAFLI